MSFLTEAAATLEYETGYTEYSLPHSKTVDLIGEEFIKKEASQAQTVQSPVSKMNSGGSLPPLTYTTTTIPTISTQVSASEETGVLYCNLDDLSRYIPDNFSFDQLENIGADENVSVQVLSLPGQVQQGQNKQMAAISFPTNDQRLGSVASTVQIQLKSSLPSNVQTLTIPTIDTTKLTGQLSVVQELPEVSKLVFQEVKQEPDSIVNILENMKQENSSLSPLDYTVSSTTGTESPLNLVNNLAKGVKRVTAPVQQIPHHSKRIKNVYVVQGEGGQQILQEVPVTQLSPEQQALSQDQFCLEPQSPTSNEVKKEPKSKSSSPKINNLNKSLNGTTLPSSKTCNWVFENGQVCGKTFSKSYNLVVHMRMHEDIRPFACTLCDQTFRQKAHLQRHETTHGIQSKNIYRQPAGSKKKKKKSSGQQLSKGLQNRLAKINQNLNKANGELEDSAGEEYMEDEEDDLYVPNGNQSKRVSLSNLHYSDNEHSNGVDNEMDTDEVIKFNNNINKVKTEVGDLNMNIITHHGEDDDTSTVENILHTVNSVPTLEQSLNCDNLLLRTIPQTRPIMSSQTAPNYPVNTSLPHITKLVESTSISGQQGGLPSLSTDLTTTSSHNLPGSYLPSSAQTNILFTTLNSPTTTVSSTNKSLSFIETSVPGAAGGSFTAGSRQIVLDNIDEHSPEIQAEILNALLADQTGYVDSSQGGLQEVWEEEIYRLNSLPSTWWVSRRRRPGLNMDDISYYSPQGYCFKNRSEIQDFLTNNTLPSDLRTDELRSPPLPIEQIPIIEDTYVQRQSVQPATTNMDTNSIAQALIANLKPEPLESLKEALNHTTRDSLSPSSTSTSAIPDTDPGIPLSTVS